MSALNAFSSICSPSWTSMARRVLPSRLELNSRDGSSREAPLAKVSFTTFLYVSPVQISPSCDHTGPPHFHSSTTPGSACLMSPRSRDSVLPRQSPSSSIRSSIRTEGALPGCAALFFIMVPSSWPSCVMVWIFAFLEPSGKTLPLSAPARASGPDVRVHVLRQHVERHVPAEHDRIVERPEVVPGAECRLRPLALPHDLAVAHLVAARLTRPGAVAVHLARHLNRVRAVHLHEEAHALLAGP